MTTKSKKTPAKGRVSAVGHGRLVRRFRVWIEQVNQTYVDVSATDEESAREKGYMKWRREDAHAAVSDVKQLEASSPNKKAQPRSGESPSASSAEKL